MRKWLVVLLMVTMVLTGCSSSNANEPDNNKGTGEQVSKTDDKTTNEKETITETVLVDQDGIKITATGLELDGLFGDGLKLLIENTSDKNLTVQSRNSSVNGYMIETLMSTDVASGKKANDSLTFSSTEMEAADIEHIGVMGFSFKVFGTDDWEDYFETPVLELRTSIADSYTQTVDDSGTELYNAGGIRIVSKGVSKNDSIFGPGLVLFISNDSDQAITVQTRNESVNGFMLNPVMSEDVLSGYKSLTAMTFFSSELEENNITEITDIELEFHIFNMDSWDTIQDTDVIKLSF